MRVRRGIVTASFAAFVLGGVASPATAGGGYVPCNDPDSTARTTQVMLEQMCFRPAIVRVPRGAHVTFRNVDAAEQIDHNVTGAGWNWGSAGNLSARHPVFRHRFNEPGIFPFQCYLHPGMVGAVIVGNPAGGLARLSSLAAGELDPASPPADTQVAAARTLPTDGGSALRLWAGATAAAALCLVLLAGAVAARSRKK